MKDDAIVLRECSEIMAELPYELRYDEEILDAVITSLQQGQNALKVRQDAQEIAIMKLESKVDKGFELVAGEFQKVRHEAELDRVHAQYAKEEAKQAKAIAEQAMLRTHEIATTAAVASAKADSAKDVAKAAGKNSFGFDPVTATICTMSIVIMIGMLVSTMKITTGEPKKETGGSIIKCGVDVDCVYEGRPANNSMPPRGRI